MPRVMRVLAGKFCQRKGNLSTILKLEQNLITIEPAHPRFDFSALCVGPGAHFLRCPTIAGEQQKTQCAAEVDHVQFTVVIRLVAMRFWQFP